MYKRVFFFLAAISLIVIWTSLAQDFSIGEIEIGAEEYVNMLVDTWEIVLDLPTIPEGVDTGQESTSWMDDTGDETSLSWNEEDADFGSWIFTWVLDSWTIPEIIPDPISRLIISEVYFDGTDEWIEITNIGEGNFVGNLTLVGVKSTSLSLSNISLLAGESKIFGDNLSQILENWCFGKTGLSLNLIDTAAINIQLFISGQRVDIFLVDVYWVNFYNDKKTSFEKVGWISTRVKTSINNKSGYIINPWVVTVSENIVTDVSFPPSQSSEDIQLPLPCVLVDQTQGIQINEIFAGDENYPAYIEFLVDEDIMIESLSISGNLLATWIDFLFDNWGRKLEKNSYFIISATNFRTTEWFENFRDESFGLKDDWNRLLITIGYWQSRQVIDMVYRSGESTGASLYFGDRSVQCARVFDDIDFFSPGFDQKFLKYISGQTITKIEYREIMTGNQSENDTCLLSGQDTQLSWTNQQYTGDIFDINNYIIRIVHVDYDPEGTDTNNEKITLLASHISGDTNALDLSKIFRLKVNGTNKTLPWSLPMDKETTFIKTFGFPNSTKDGSVVVITLTHGDKVFDTYTYDPNKEKPEELLTWDLELTGNLLDISGLNFTISYVIPNPKWSDIAEEVGIVISLIPTLIITGRENNNIAFYLGSGEENGDEVLQDSNPPPQAVPLLYQGGKWVMEWWRSWDIKDSLVLAPLFIPLKTGQEIRPDVVFQIWDEFNLNEGFSLKVGSRSKKLSGTVFVGQENSVVGSLGLVNKAACVSLMYKEIELDKFCYPNPKEGQKIYSSSVDLETVEEHNLDILNKLKIKRVGNTLCTMYLDSTIICKRIPASKAEKKTVNEKNLYKWFSTFIKNYLVQDWRAIYYDTKVKSYYDILAENKKLIAKGVFTVNIYGQSISVTSIKKQIEAMENTVSAVVAAYEWVKALEEK